MIKTFRILVVDDEPEIIQMMKFYLEKYGHTVFSAGNGREGLKKIDEAAPELIITDISMPDMEGIEFLRQLKKLGKDIPVIVMSGNIVGKKFLESAHKFGAKCSITKPFTGEELISVIQGCYESHCG